MNRVLLTRWWVPAAMLTLVACGDDASGGAGAGASGGAGGLGGTPAGGAPAGGGGASGGGGTSGAGAGGESGVGGSGQSGVGAGEGGGAGTGGTGAGRECDLSGLWMVQRVLFTQPNSPLAPGTQKVSSWDLFEVAQDGDDVTFVDHLFAGIVTTGDARVHNPDATILALQQQLDETGRRGTFKRTAEGCELTLERVYNVMGASPIEFYRGGVAVAPGRIDGNPGLAMLEPMPTNGGNPGADDWDGDGRPGIQFVITDSPLGSGVRHETQRDWHEMRGTVEPGADEFQVPVTWDFEETVIESSNPFFGVVAVTKKGAPHTAIWKRADDSVYGTDGAETAKNVQAVLPHEAMPRDGL